MRRATPVTFALMSVRSPYTREHYRGRLKEFFDFVGIPGDSLDEQGQAFLAQAKADDNNSNSSRSDGTSGSSKSNNDDYWAEDTILSFLDHQKQRVSKGELAASTLQTFYAPIRAFCAVHQRDLPFIDWKGISKTLPESPTYSSDRAPTREEIQKVIQYPNRMMKPLKVRLIFTSDPYTKLRSGITGVVLGRWDDDLHVTRIDVRWSNGSRLSMIEGTDQIQKIA